MNRGHLFSLRPRVTTSFSQEDFRAARVSLEGEADASIEEAARAVFEKALELSQEGPPRHGFGRRGR